MHLKVFHLGRLRLCSYAFLILINALAYYRMGVKSFVAQVHVTSYEKWLVMNMIIFCCEDAMKTEFAKKQKIFVQFHKTLATRIIS